MDNNKILIIGIILLIGIILKFNMIENFTQNEYNNYSSLLKENCNRNKEILSKIKKLNNYRCNKKGDTTRETINNKTLCYDDIGKEIVTNLDKESYCNMTEYKLSKNKSKSNKSKSEDLTESHGEGPNFINKFYLDSYNSKKLDNDFIFDNTDNKSFYNYPVSTSYSNVSFSSDPSFLSKISNLNNTK
jgi:hypothetical protein